MVPQIVQGDLRHKDTVIFWLAIALIVVSVAFISTVLSLTIKCILRRRGRYEKVEKQARSTNSTKNALSLWGVKPDRDLQDRIEEEELQREYMIRKSYASRGSLRTSSQLSLQSNDLDLEAGEASAVAVKTDGKEEEARFHGDQRRPPEIHSAFVHPTSEFDLYTQALSMQELPPPPSRHTRHSSRSSSRTTTLRMLGADSSARIPRAMIRHPYP